MLYIYMLIVKKGVRIHSKMLVRGLVEATLLLTYLPRLGSGTEFFRKSREYHAISRPKQANWHW